jgi:hypothetical protein
MSLPNFTVSREARMGAKVVRIEEHPRFRRKESEVPVHILDEDDGSTVDEILDQIRVTEKE